MNATKTDNEITKTQWTGEAPDPGVFGWSLRGVVILALTTGALAAMAGLAFAGWSKHGTDMLMTYISSGLSWCL